MIKAVIFDWDGVLMDSTGSGFKRIDSICEYLGWLAPNYEQKKECWGDTYRKVLKHWGKILGWPERCEELFIETEIKLESENFSSHRLNGGSMEVLEKLSQNYLLGVISNREPESFRMFMEGFKIAKFFKFVQSLVSQEIAKPNPLVFYPTLANLKRKFGLNTSEIVYVGDTVNYDFKTVKNYNLINWPELNFIGFCGLISSKENFIEAGLEENLVIKSMRELLSALEVLNAKKEKRRKEKTMVV